jgi:multicomponent Na+:H+ antiporter subunit G
VNPVSATLVLAGAALAVLAGVGVLRFTSPYARFHAAGKASPVAFLIVAIGGAIELGGAGAALLMVATGAMILTLPVAVHLLFRAVHRVTPGDHLEVDDLASDERRHRE